MEIVYAVFVFIYKLIIEFIFFLVIDYIAKEFLKRAKEQERYKIYRKESYVLGITIVSFFYFLYTPYGLICLTIGPLLFSSVTLKDLIISAVRCAVKKYSESRSFHENNVYNHSCEIKSNLNYGNSISTEISSAAVCIPSGLSNNGQNVCFINVGLQCLTHTPKFLSKLEDAISQSSTFGCEHTLLLSLQNVLQKCYRNNSQTVDGNKFYEAASKLKPNLIANPNTRLQRQQDVAEFLTWLFDIIHSCLRQEKNLNSFDNTFWKSLISNEGSILKGKLKLNSWTDVFISNLKTEFTITLKKACFLDDAFKIETIQQLSDIEWIKHKKYNSSPVDDLFIGQLIDGVQCLACRNLTIRFSPFMILPLPIVSNSNNSEMVDLQDCLQHVEVCESLEGSNGLRCNCCNPQDTPNNFIPTLKALSQYNLKNRTNKSFHYNRINNYKKLNDSLDLVLSPIPDIEGDSKKSFFEEMVKTSTPKKQDSINLTDAIKRTMFGHLPDCLIIQLLRFKFNYDAKLSQKIQQPISFPVVNLQLYSTMNCYHKHHCIYDLYAVCLHKGNNKINFGHYITICLCEDGNWYKFDDNSVTRVTMEFECNSRYVRENAYILFYKRRTNNL